MVEYFVRSCTFEKQAGYVERAVALFQALILCSLLKFVTLC